MFSKIVLPWDGSPVAEIALPYARALAQGLNLPVTLLSAIDLEEVARHIAIERGLFLDTLDDFETHRRHEYLSATAKSYAAWRSSAKSKKAWPPVRLSSMRRPTKTFSSSSQPMAAPGCNVGYSAASRRKSCARRRIRCCWCAPPKAEPPIEFRRSIASSFPSMVPVSPNRCCPLVAELAKHLDLEVILFRSYNVPYASYYEGGGSYAVDLPQLSAAIETDVALS